MKKTPYGAAKAFLEAVLAAEIEDCVDWPFTSNKPGHYGCIKIAGRHRRVNRVVCEYTHGKPVSPDYQAAHSCGNDQCINPRHIRWATPKQNVGDKYDHGTMPLGEGVHSAKLTADNVRQIRSLHGHLSGSELARQFGVSRANISLIIRGQAWRSVE